MAFVERDKPAGATWGKGISLAIDAVLPGVGTYFQDAAMNQWIDRKGYLKVLEEARSKLLSYQSLTAKQQLALNEIENALNDLKTSPARATNRGAMAKDLKERRAQVQKNMNKYSALTDLYSNAANPTSGESSNDIRGKLDVADNIAKMYEKKI